MKVLLTLNLHHTAVNIVAVWQRSLENSSKINGDQEQFLTQYVIILKYNCSYAQLVFCTWRWGNKEREINKRNKDNGGSDGGEFDGVVNNWNGSILRFFVFLIVELW
jgi:hypothetical protein